MIPLASHADVIRGSSRVPAPRTQSSHALQSLYVCVWHVNTLTSIAPIGSPTICMWSPADICEQWVRNLSFSSTDVRGAGTRDKPLRTSVLEASDSLCCQQLGPEAHWFLYNKWFLCFTRYTFQLYNKNRVCKQLYLLYTFNLDYWPKCQPVWPSPNWTIGSGFFVRAIGSLHK